MKVISTSSMTEPVPSKVISTSSMTANPVVEPVETTTPNHSHLDELGDPKSGGRACRDHDPNESHLDKLDDRNPGGRACRDHDTDPAQTVVSTGSTTTPFHVKQDHQQPPRATTSRRIQRRVRKGVSGAPGALKSASSHRAI
ncbi:hypothetical protein NBCG_00557 [Nocardioidaceae bacterium Broad-1]|nr:hypothetical protein NBCG_00557 [Nocardioidaceae bacterium Broad-1]